MDVTISNPDLEVAVKELVAAGAFPSAAAVVELALSELLYEAEPLTPEDLEAIAESDAQFERGEYIDFNTFKARMKAKYGLD